MRGHGQLPQTSEMAIIVRNPSQRSGSWFSYGDQRIGQGRENAKQFLKDNPDAAAEIEQAIRANAGLIAEAITAGPDADGDDDEDNIIGLGNNN